MQIERRRKCSRLRNSSRDDGDHVRAQKKKTNAATVIVRVDDAKINYPRVLSPRSHYISIGAYCSEIECDKNNH